MRTYVQTLNWFSAIFFLLQCNEPRTDDAPAADISLSNSAATGKKGLEAGKCLYNSCSVDCCSINAL